MSNKVGAIGRVWKLASPMSLYPQGLQASPQVPLTPFETDSGLGDKPFDLASTKLTKWYRDEGDSMFHLIWFRSADSRINHVGP